MEGGKTLWLQARRCPSLLSSSLVPKQRNRQRCDDERDATCDSAPRPSHSEGCCSTAPAPASAKAGIKLQTGVETGREAGWGGSPSALGSDGLWMREVHRRRKATRPL